MVECNATLMWLLQSPLANVTPYYRINQILDRELYHPVLLSAIVCRQSQFSAMKYMDCSFHNFY